MPPSPHISPPLLAFGTVAVALGSIALALFFMPILSIPIALCGLVAGGIGLVRTLAPWQRMDILQRRSELRWAIMGCALCGAVAVLGFIIAYAPLGETPHGSPPSPFWALSEHQYVPPPAQPK